MASIFSRIVAVIFLLWTSNASALSSRKFAAAPKSASLRRSNINLKPSYEQHTLLFQDETSSETAARVHLLPKYPTLILDDIIDHTKNVNCTKTSIEIGFHSRQLLRRVGESWKGRPGFVLFSSHPTCAPSGTYEAYIVRSFDLNTTAGSIKLYSERRALKQVAHRISVDLGAHAANDIDRKILQRSALTTATVSSAFDANQTASVPPTASFDFIAPTASATGSGGAQHISFSELGSTILPPSPAILEAFPNAAPLEFISLGCKNCTMAGSIDLEVAGFDVNSTDLGEVIDFINNGFLQFTTRNMTARMLFELSLLPGFTPSKFTANLARFPLTPIEIPNVITLGPVMELTIPLGVTLNSSVNFTTGFEIAVPDNSKIIMNFSEISNSSQSGFDESNFSMLPFTASADDLSFNLTASLKPKLTISAGVGPTKLGLGVNGGVGAFIDFPKLVAQVSTVQNVNNTCDGPVGKGVTNRAFQVLPSAELNMGLHWEFGVEVGSTNVNRDGEQNLISKTFDLPSQCLIFESETETPSSAPMPTPSQAHSTNSSSGTQSDSNSAPPGLETFSAYAVVLLVTAGVFIAL